MRREEVPASSRNDCLASVTQFVSCVKPYFGIRGINRFCDRLVAKRNSYRYGAEPGEAQAIFDGWSAWLAVIMRARCMFIIGHNGIKNAQKEGVEDPRKRGMVRVPC